MVGDSLIKFVNMVGESEQSQSHCSVRTNNNLGTDHITIWLENIKQISVACFAEEVGYKNNIILVIRGNSHHLMHIRFNGGIYIIFILPKDEVHTTKTDLFTYI